ncbi:FAD-binding oxidoreductase [Pseudoduganella namucuonensis]|uniref:FAD binding domain-containing protein n=1 Tax=Pseudoduganella namucuonensis TaxID=1035707 RepID=A0A1I7GGM2_9BURK|nr:FAD-dependent oxidoreductase [Pseudoduganella namucuonensis]SFU47461.1 FAD binding domain-containing protein [Pseudoduganella namucuonensis]
MTPSPLELAISEWRAVPGVAEILDGEQAQLAYGFDTSGCARAIPAALRIAGNDKDDDCVSAVMRIAQRHGVAVHPISTGRNWGYGTSLPSGKASVVLDLSGLREFTLDEELGVVTLQPGVTQGMLADFLDSKNLPFLVPVTGAGPSCSLLSNALERGYGVTPHTDHFAAVTDLDAVLADGSLYRTTLREAGTEELARLFKWGLGPHSAPLFTQSGFGIVTRMSIVLARRPACIKVCLFNLKDDALLETAVERVRDILRLLPGTVGGINLMNRHRVLAMNAPYPDGPPDQHGQIPAEVIEKMGGQYQIAPWTGFCTLYGSKGMVAAAQKEIRRALNGVGTRMLFLSPGNARTLAQLARWLPGGLGERLGSTAATLAKSLDLVAGRPNETALPLAYWRNPGPQPLDGRDPGRDGCGLMWYAPLVPMRPSYARAYVNMVTRVARKHGMEPLLTFTSVNERLFDSTVPLLFDRARPDAVARAKACYAELLEEGRAIGVFPYRVGVDTMARIVGAQKHSHAFHERLRVALDPHDLLAPGRYR